MAAPTLTITVPDAKLMTAVQNPATISGTVNPSAGTTVTAWLIHELGFRINGQTKPSSDNWSINFGTLSYGYYLLSISASNGGATSPLQVLPMLVAQKGA